MIKLQTFGNTPSKKNSNKIRCTGKFPQVYKTAVFKQWYKDNTLPLTAQISPYRELLPMQSIKCITMTFFSQTRRKSDIDNHATSILDLLVDLGILEDDNWSVIPMMIIKFGGHDKENPRCDIEIQE